MSSGVGCVSFTSLWDRLYRHSFSTSGLRSTPIHLDQGNTTLHLWTPRSPDPTKPTLILLHGFGANAMWQWDPHLPTLSRSFNVHVPDLLFFGSSHTTLPDRSDAFQADALVRALDALEIRTFAVVGVSYGGFVAYRVAELFPERVDKLVLCCAGVCLEERDLKEERLFVVDDVRKAAEILLPQTPEKLRELIGLSFVNPPPAVPSCFLSDYINVMCTEFVQEKIELLEALIKGRKLADVPKITQPTMIVWGEEDQIFPVELGHRLNRHLEGNSKLVVIKNAGHAVNLEKPKEFCKYMMAFLVDPPPSNNKSISTPSYLGILEKKIKSICSSQVFFQLLQLRRPSKKALASTSKVEG